ncbi:MAG TPA: restriction endonuclease subunit S [Candidatus Limnocylindrales bacterium]
MGEIETQRLGDLVENLDRKRVPISSRERAKRQGEYPYYGAAGVLDHIDGYLFDGTYVLVGEDGTVETPSGSAMVQFVRGRFWANNHAHVLRAATDADTRYLAYALTQVPIHPFLTGSVQLKLTQANLNDIKVAWPARHVRERIAGLLGAIDDAIDEYAALVGVCELLVTAELTRASITAEDWTEVPLTAIARFVNGGAYTKGASGRGRIVLRIRELNSGVGEGTVYSEIEVPKDQEADPGDILFPWSGSLGLYRWRGPNAIINQHIFKVIPRACPAWFVYARVLDHLPEFREIARDKATTMGHIQRSHLDEALVLLPDTQTMGVLDARLGPVWDLVLECERAMTSLSSMRDVLLPALIAGRLPREGWPDEAAA